MKISNLSKEKISVINKFLKKNGIEIFSAKFVKALKDDLLRVCYMHDEVIIKGCIYTAIGEETGNTYFAIALSHGLECVDVLLCDENHNPLKLVERFNVMENDIEE